VTKNIYDIGGGWHRIEFDSDTGTNTTFK
jgi:hypothetical protein